MQVCSLKNSEDREREYTLFSEKINNCGRPGSWALSTVCNPRFPLLNGPEGPINRHSIHQLTQNGLANPNSTSGGVDISKIINILFMLRTILQSSLHNIFFSILLRHHFLLLHHQQLPLVPLRNRPSTVDSKRTASNDFRQVSDDLSCLLYPKSTKASRHRK